MNRKMIASPGSVRGILPPEGATSSVWQYFGFAAKDDKFIEAGKKKRVSVHCWLCAKVLPSSKNQ